MGHSINSISIKRRSQAGLKVMQTAWRIRKSTIIGYFSGAIIEIVAMVVSIYATAKLGSLLAKFITGQHTENIWFWLWIDIVAITLTSISFWVMAFFQKLLYYSLAQWSIKAYMQQICSIDIQDFYDNKTRDEINRLGNDYTWKLSDLGYGVFDLIYATLRFAAIAAVVSQITWWLVPLIAVFLIPTLIAESKMQDIQWFIFNKKGDERHIYWGIDFIIRQAKSQLELRSLQAKNYVINKVDRMNKDFYSEQEQSFKKTSRIVVPSKILEVIGTATGSIVVLKQFLSGTIALDRYFFLSGALLRIGAALNNIFGSLTRIQEKLLYADSYFRFLERKPIVADIQGAIKLPADKPVTVVFENMTFAYREDLPPVFSNLNLTIKAGEHVALVGENGAGKSTLIKLLLRFYYPTSGRILIDGIDLKDLEIESWYGQVATLFQEFNHYPFSIKENVEVAKPQKASDDKRLNQVAKFSGLDELISNYEHGWDTVLDSSFEKGIEPSGGQWQKVALARAFYRNANTIILDEPTSAIDAKAEYDIFNNIFEQYQDRTTIIVSHRFSTVRRADRIVVLDQGKIIEQGSHKELIKVNGLYEEMLSKQAEGYRD